MAPVCASISYSGMMASVPRNGASKLCHIQMGLPTQVFTHGSMWDLQQIRVSAPKPS